MTEYSRPFTASGVLPESSYGSLIISEMCSNFSFTRRQSLGHNQRSPSNYLLLIYFSLKLWFTMLYFRQNDFSLQWFKPVIRKHDFSFFKIPSMRESNTFSPVEPALGVNLLSSSFIQEIKSLPITIAYNMQLAYSLDLTQAFKIQ